ncbi:MAG: hypothetical protein EPN89_16615 [Methylovulum sp.]|nr:MAG: hypothetical protein EPN89_16615 [Methylovulum sp.]
MMTTETVMPEEQLIRQATDALINNLGIMEATRFLTINRQSRLESVDRHRLWQSGLDKEEFFNEVFATKKQAQ